MSATDNDAPGTGSAGFAVKFTRRVRLIPTSRDVVVRWTVDPTEEAIRDHIERINRR